MNSVPDEYGAMYPKGHRSMCPLHENDQSQFSIFGYRKHGIRINNYDFRFSTNLPTLTLQGEADPGGAWLHPLWPSAWVKGRGCLELSPAANRTVLVPKWPRCTVTYRRASITSNSYDSLVTAQRLLAWHGTCNS
jgi:hypothetical protein